MSFIEKLPPQFQGPAQVLLPMVVVLAAIVILYPTLKEDLGANLWSILALVVIVAGVLGQLASLHRTGKLLSLGHSLGWYALSVAVLYLGLAVTGSYNSFQAMSEAEQVREHIAAVLLTSTNVAVLFAVIALLWPTSIRGGLSWVSKPQSSNPDAREMAS